MRVTLRAHETNEKHTRFTVFVNGQNCGDLCMGPEEARVFYMIVVNGCHPELDQFVGQGHWDEASQQEEEDKK